MATETVEKETVRDYSKNIDKQKKYIEQMDEEIKLLKNQLANMNTEH